MENKHAKKPTFACTRLRLKEKLDAAGCKLLTVCPNKWNPRYFCWIYKRDEKLTAIVDEFEESIKSL